MSNELTVVNGEGKEELYTQKEMAQKLGISVGEVSKRVADAGLKPSGRKTIMREDGKPMPVPAYSLAELTFFQEEERKKALVVADRVDKVIGEFTNRKLGAMVMQSTIKRLGKQGKRYLAAALIADLSNDNDEKDRVIENLQTDNKLLKDEHTKYWSWIRIIKDYGEYIVNGYQIKDFKSWYNNKLKIDGKFLGEVVKDKKQIPVANSKYDKQFSFNIYQVCDFFKLPYPETDETLDNTDTVRDS